MSARRRSRYRKTRITRGDFSALDVVTMTEGMAPADTVRATLTRPEMESLARALDCRPRPSSVFAAVIVEAMLSGYSRVEDAGLAEFVRSQPDGERRR